jgi:solute carrier organic anion transporter family, member 5A
MESFVIFFLNFSSTTLSTCNLNCMCDFTPYSPVCGTNNMSYLSACHAGCAEEMASPDGGTVYQNCSCINGVDDSAFTGVCPVDCQTSLIYFLVVLCAIKFLAGTEGTANFMIEMRCVDTKDKIIVLAISEVAIDLFALFPSPILFGYIIDSTCILFGKSCSGEGNCWLYNEEQMRYLLNLTAAGFILIGTLLDVGTWWHSENVLIFDEDDASVEDNRNEAEMRELQSFVEK